MRQFQAEAERLHSYSKAVLSLAADDIEWWAAGPREILPWAGTWRGKEEIARWFQVLNGAVTYDRWEAFEYVAQRETVVEFVRGAGTAKATGRRYESDIVRVWTFRDGKLARVRSFYDTAKYVEAMRRR